MSDPCEQFLPQNPSLLPLEPMIEKVILNMKVLPKMTILTEPGDVDADHVLNSLSKISRFKHFQPGLPERILDNFPLYPRLKVPSCDQRAAFKVINTKYIFHPHGIWTFLDRRMTSGLCISMSDRQDSNIPPDSNIYIYISAW